MHSTEQQRSDKRRAKSGEDLAAVNVIVESDRANAILMMDRLDSKQQQQQNAFMAAEAEKNRAAQKEVAGIQNQGMMALVGAISNLAQSAPSSRP